MCPNFGTLKNDFTFGTNGDHLVKERQILFLREANRKCKSYLSLNRLNGRLILGLTLAAL